MSKYSKILRKNTLKKDIVVGSLIRSKRSKSEYKVLQIGSVEGHVYYTCMRLIDKVECEILASDVELLPTLV